MTIIFIRIKQTTNHDINFTFWSAALVPANGGGGNNQWTLIRHCNLSWYSSGDSKHLGACRQSTIYPGSRSMSYGEDCLHQNQQSRYAHTHKQDKVNTTHQVLWGRLSAPEPAVKLHSHTHTTKVNTSHIHIHTQQKSRQVTQCGDWTHAHINWRLVLYQLH